MTKEIYIYGASGHGRVVYSIAQALGCHVLGFIDDDPFKIKFDGLSVISVRDSVATHEIVVAIGDSKIRAHISDKLIKSGFKLGTLVHPKAIVHNSVSVGEGAVIMAGAIVAVGSIIGRGVIVNHGAIVDHDCTIGDYTHICPGASVAGGVKIGSASWIGINSTIIQNLIIGDDVIVGAGSVVIKSVPNKAKIAGVPAKPI